MSTFIFAFGIIIFSLCLGKSIRWLVETKRIPLSWNIDRVLKLFIRVALIGINPIVLVGAFWFVQLDHFNLVYIPALGIGTIALGGALGIVAAKLLKRTRQQTGSMFVSGAFLNLGSFGTLFCFLFLGEESLAFVGLFRMFEELIYFAVAFPIAKSYGVSKAVESQKSVLKKLITDPFIMATFIAIVIGGALNASPLERPDFYRILNQILVPLFTVLLVIPIGFSMRLNSVRRYLKESFSISAIKFLIVPSTVTIIAYLLGLGELYNGMILGVILILSAMPPATTSLIPPQLYELDVDLANTSWLINTGLLLIVVPILYVIIQLF